MKKRRIELLLLLITLLLFPSALLAQDDMSFDMDEVDETVDDMSFDGEEAEGIDDEADDSGLGGGLGGDLVDIDSLGLGGDISADSPDATVGAPSETKKMSESELLIERHPIWALQQVYALRKGRFDFQPSFGVSLNDPYVQHQSFNLSLAYFITEVLSVGVSFNWYGGLQAETDVNYSLSRATHQTVPINEYLGGGQLSMSYIPMYGKFAFLTNWIIHWDFWISGGGGFLFTRPISVIDPDYRTFDYKAKVAFNIGLGGRLYLTRFLAVFVEVKDYIYPEEVESIITSTNPRNRQDEQTWTDSDRKLTNNVMLQAGISLFLPFTFDFKLPK